MKYVRGKKKLGHFIFYILPLMKIEIVSPIDP